MRASGARRSRSRCCAPPHWGWALAHGGHHLVAATTLMSGLLGASVCLPLAALLHRPSHTRDARMTARP